MIVFILEAWHALEWKRTAVPFHEAGSPWRVIPITMDACRQMLSHLKADSSPCFLLLISGDWVRSTFPAEAIRWMEQLEPGDTGVIPAVSGDFFRHTPILWRTSAVRELLSASSDLFALPFAEWLGFAICQRMGRNGNWQTKSCGGWLPREQRAPIRTKSDPIRALTEPILASKAQISPTAGEQAKATIVICTYNNPGYLPWSVRSVIVQTLPLWRLIVIDDGSVSEETAGLLRPYKADDRIRLIELDTNRGKGSCLNTTLSLVDTPWLLELDDDDWLTPDCLAHIMKTAERSPPDVAVLFGDSHEWWERKNGQLVYKGIRSGKIDVLSLWADGFPPTPRLYRMDLLRSLGGWRTDDPFNGRLFEDVQMLARLSKQYRFQHVEQPLYHRRIRSSSISRIHANCFQSWKRWFLSEFEQS